MKYKFVVLSENGLVLDKKVSVLLELGTESHVASGPNQWEAQKRVTAEALLETCYIFTTLPKELEPYQLQIPGEYYFVTFRGHLSAASPIKPKHNVQ